MKNYLRNKQMILGIYVIKINFKKNLFFSILLYYYCDMKYIIFIFI